ncbi:MAG: hypothetical protein HKO93_08050 [Flavobacteriales bacterium]|nr:hypothetical protein [Flavobacteriales bacterium]
MIKFFRHIRKRMLKENRLTRYTLYAIGEIFLVMIGILLALQVSNWNQERIAHKKERLLLDALHEEFMENKTQLDTVVSYHKKALASTRYMISQFPIDTETIDLESLTRKTKFWGYRFTFNPSQGVIRSLVNTSSFDLISNEELRALLVSWEDVLADYQEEEVMASEAVKTYQGPRLMDNVSWRGYEDERFDKEYLTSIQFENIFYTRENNILDIFGGVTGGGELLRIQKTIDRIIELSAPEEQ